MALMAGHPDANEVAPRPRGGIRLMAEKARDPKVSPANAGFTGYTEIQGIGGLPCADNFYETLLAMASHDLRQPLQLIISAQELLARRVTASPEREHLECSKRASAQLAEQLDQLVDALHLHQSTGGIRPEPVPLQPILGASRNSSTERRGGKACVSVSCREAPR
jgi:hypothetical protein